MLPVRYLHLTGPDGLPAEPKSVPHCAIVVAECSLEPSAMFVIATWLVRAGCNLMMAWGLDGSAWDDAGDWAEINEAGRLGRCLREPMTTTWHDHEALNEVYAFASGWNVSDEAFAHRHMLVLHIAIRSDEPRIMSLLTAPLAE
ncbi:MAG: DUF7684 family protein [Paracoccaceae bacterium]